MLGLRRTLLEMGVDKERLHFEFFGPTPEY